MRVLVAEDDPATRLAVAAAVARLGHEVTEATDGAAALAACRADPPDVVIADWEMPGLDGAELTARLREDAATAAVHVLVLTAHAESSADATGLVRGGADGILHKPLDADELERRLLAAERAGALHRRLRDAARRTR